MPRRRGEPRIDPSRIVSSRPVGMAAAAARGQSGLEAQFALICRSLGLTPVPEYEFAREALGRRWRFDFAWPDRKIGIEIEGGIWASDADDDGPGRHTRGAGFEADCRKYNAAALLGWTVLRFTEGMLTSGEARETLEQIGPER